MASNRNVSSENIWLKDKYVSEELRAIGFDYDCAMISASQLGRGAIDAEKVTHAHIQGGISKIQTCDLMISIIQNDLMRAAGEYIFEFTKTRNSGGVGQSVLLRWDPIGLRVSNISDPSQGLKLKPKSLGNEPPIKEVLNTGGTFLDKSSSTHLLNLTKL
jgi:hypothetical protein